MVTCTNDKCPGNVLNQPHVLGDNECGFLNKDGKPLPKNRNDRYHSCRRPGCSRGHLSAERRDKHEADATRHPGDGRMDFLCDWEGHADAIDEVGFCSVCQ